MKKPLLLLETESSEFVPKKSENGDIYLEGIFTVFDDENRNGRIYTKKEFWPHYEALKLEVDAGKCLGELDHPKIFDTSLKNASHRVDKIWYDESKNAIMGRIKLLNTDNGKQAQALVNDGVRLHISSRAAGSVTENKTVKINRLFAYDLVDKPGCKQAEMFPVNESYGFVNENFFMYEVEDNNTKFDYSENSELNNKKNVNMEEFLKESDFNEYSKFNKDTLSDIKEELNAIKQVQEGLVKTNDEILNSDNEAILEKLQYVSDKIADVEKWAKSMQDKPTTPVATTEGTEGTEGATAGATAQMEEDVNPNTDLIERLTKLEGLYTEALIKISALEEWSEEVTECVTAIEDWTDHTTQTVTAIENWTNEATDQINAFEKWSDGATETVTAVEEWASHVTESVSAIEKWSEDLMENHIEKNKLNNNTKVDENLSFDNYKTEIFAKLETILESKMQNETKDTSLLENQNVIVKPVDTLLESMPVRFDKQWKSLSESDKSRIRNRSKIYNFDNETSIEKFWTGQFNSVKPNIINENVVVKTEQTISTDAKKKLIIEQYHNQFGNRLV